MQQKAYEFIKEQILSLRVSPGDRLIAGTIADYLGISRTPVREALSRLEQESLLSRESGWGFTVTAMDLEDVLDLYRVRKVLEVEAVREAAQRIDDTTLAYMASTLKCANDFRKRGETVKFLEQCRLFHGAIAMATRNRLLQQMLGMINDRIRIVSATILKQHQPRAFEIYTENVELLKALKRRDPESAAGAVSTHIGNAEQYAVYLLGTRQSRSEQKRIRSRSRVA